MTQPIHDGGVLLRDHTLGARLSSDGFIVIEDFLDTATIATLWSVFESHLGDVEFDPPWFTSGMLADTTRRRGVFDAVGAVLRPELDRVIDATRTDVIAGHFHVNPSAAHGGLGPHQDVAIVDELRYTSLNGWCPLMDSDLSNGTLHVVPGSHRLGNCDRSLAVPWAYQGLHETFWELAEPIEVPAGTLVLFDTAMVHCSSTNHSDTTRVAVNCLLKPSDASMLHLVADGDSPSGHIDIYEVPTEFYIDGDLTARPATSDAHHVDSRRISVPDVRPSAIRERCVAASGRPAGRGSATSS